MIDPRLARRRLTERLLRGGEVPFAQLLELLVPAARLRELARRLGLTPKGGFRLDKAPANVVAVLLAEQRDAEHLDDVVALLFADADAGDGADEPAPAVDAPPEAPAPDLRPVLALREAELQRVRDELERAREATARALERESALRRDLDELRAASRRGRETAHRDRDEGGAEGQRAETERELASRIHDLELEIEARDAADAALRRQLAADKSRLRELEEEVAELEALLPSGRRRRKPLPPPPPPERRFLLPWFTPAFYRSLDGKDRKAVERALQAILLFCTEGHAYPGLEVKQLGGQDTWSLRASLGLRVYFRHRDDGDIEVLELANREDQHTALRRLKER